jgi:assimilatory nitrate reductase catalytic subunit
LDGRKLWPVSVKTTCAYCGVGCGIVATPTGARSAEIKGDPDHPANFGKLCSKGAHLGETIGLEGRLLYPEIAGQRTDWDSALQNVADRFKATVAEFGPESVAFYVSGQLLTEDYYVANKLMKGFIGTANIDTNSRLCMASAVAAHVRAFGEDVVPCSYSDLGEADLIILVGSNTAWCHPVVWQQIEEVRAKRGTKLVVIDPRRTETAERADLHIAIAPDGDVALFNALLAHMRATGKLDDMYLSQHVNEPEGFWDSLKPGTEPGWAELFELFAQTPKTVTLFSQGVNQSTSGTDKANAIINLHLATGRIGKVGAGPFSITGQPNAMGGREVGGLASMLACHMGFGADERDRAQRFWQSPVICTGPGLKAVEMFDAVADGRIKAIWIIATNPAVSMPAAREVRAALAACPLVIVSDCIAATDTSQFAHIKLPACAWGEKDGTVTNSERVVSRQRGFLAAPGEARPDWWIIAEVAKRMGWGDSFDYPNTASIFREYAAMTAFENDGERILNLSDQAGMSDADYADLHPFQWGGSSPFATQPFTTPNGRANLIAVADRARSVDPFLPLRLNTARYRDQWHTMTRTGLSPRLSQHRREPLVEVHPVDAAHYGLAEHGFARVTTASGEGIFRVTIDPGQQRGSLCVPMHWTDQMSSGGRANLLPPKDHDPISGQPGFKNTPARIEPVVMKWAGFLVADHDPVMPAGAVYWTKVRTAGGWLVELAGDCDPLALRAMLPPGDRAEVVDEKRALVRSAVISDGQLHAALFISGDFKLPPRDWLIDRLSHGDVSTIEILAGRSASPQPDRGPIICVCFDIGLRTILDCIAAKSLTSVAEVGAALGAGTNCGSCRPALARLLESETQTVDA